MLEFDAGTLTRILDDVVLSFDPTGSTVEIKVDSTWHAAIWLDTPVECDKKWMQTAQTVEYFAGPEVSTPGAAVLLSSAPRHRTQTRVTKGNDIIVSDASQIQVV